MKRLRLVAIIVLFAGGCAPGSRPSQALAPCALAEGPADAHCGVLDVWENRRAKSGRRIALKVIVLPALRSAATARPVFLLAGGPGQGAAALVDGWRRLLGPIQRAHDIVLVDTRGTGSSHPLECKETGSVLQGAELDARSTEVLRACLAAYRDYADVTQYTTANAVDDLDEVRARLGYSTIDLYGVSYGTRVAMMYVSRYRARVGAVVLDSVFPPENHVPSFLARDAQRSLDLLVQGCEANVPCRTRFPNLGARVQALLVRLAAAPQQITLRDPRTGVAHEATVTRTRVTRTLLTALYVPEWTALVPLLIDQAERGRFDGVFALDRLAERLSDTIAKGLQYSVLCAEDIAAGSNDAAPPAVSSFIGTDAERAARHLCSVWPSEPTSASDWHSEPSDGAALFISGELDPITPPSWAELLAKRWTRARQIVVPGASHNASASECLVGIMAAFLTDPSADLDTSCVARHGREPFVLDTSGPDPSDRHR